MPTPPVIADLVERFEQQGDAYKSGQYNEAQLRKEFIDPMFKALGWDMENVSGYAEAYKDVIHEDAIKIGGATKAPDYCFRIGGTRKFFLEAKKPSVDIKTDAHPAYQLRRYAWSAKLPLSILTDFEEFAVYDCRVEPKLDDKASVARVLYLDFREYGSRWDDIAKIFARDAILKGSFDKFAESTKAKRGTAEVDDAFLSEIEKWRADLARNLALRNPKLSQRDLNFSVQRTIDRIVFLRICEDRRIEVYGRLQALLNGEHTYRRLYQLFREADERYNSGLFYFQKEKGRVEPPDDLTPELEIHDVVLKKIIRRLYYPDSPYEFSVLPADILGQVYEQFLGKVIRLTEGHQARIEDKPEVKKAGGVYYTPTYIVDYIVKNSVGKLLENKTPKQAAKLRILDPACGSGSFLIGAYQYLLDWHRDWYSDNEAKKWATGKNAAIYQGPGGEWKLTTTERKRILLQNIFGVDIDSQAVEVTKLSLLLKVLEGESEQTLATQLRFYHERALPDLGRNIKCGNSLIGSDFYDQQELSFLDEEERYRINVFDWKAEFPEIMKAGGFDAVIGNPPYIRMEAFKELKRYLESNYETHAERSDIYFYFVEAAHRLLRRDAYLGFILSNTFTRSESGRALRRFTIRQFAIKTLVEFGDFLPFKNATVYPIITILQRADSKQRAESVEFILQSHEPGPTPAGFASPVNLPAARFTDNEWTFEEQPMRKLRDRLLKQFPSLREVYGPVNMGIKTGLNEAFIIDAPTRRKILARNKAASEIIEPYLGGRNLDRYRAQTEGEFLIYTFHGIDMSDYPAVVEHLERFRRDLAQRATEQKWYELQQPQTAFRKHFDGAKIIYPDISRYPKFSLDELGSYFSNTVYFIGSSSKFLLGLLNSKLLWFVIRGLSNALRGGLWRFRLFSGHVERLPMPSKIDKARHDRMVEFVERMLDLHKQLAAAKTDHAKTNLQR